MSFGVPLRSTVDVEGSGVAIWQYQSELCKKYGNNTSVQIGYRI